MTDRDQLLAEVAAHASIASMLHAECRRRPVRVDPIALARELRRALVELRRATLELRHLDAQRGLH